MPSIDSWVASIRQPYFGHSIDITRDFVFNAVFPSADGAGTGTGGAGGVGVAGAGTSLFGAGFGSAAGAGDEDGDGDGGHPTGPAGRAGAVGAQARLPNGSTQYCTLEV